MLTRYKKCVILNKKKEKMKIVSLTLARGGSKGVPRKNLINICGKPLIHYVLDSAKKSKYIQKRFVSTEDSEIKEVATSLGAEVVDRPMHLASDSAKCEDALLHFSSLVEFDVLCFIQTTSPLVLPKDIDKGIEMVLNSKYDSVFSVTPETWVPKWIETSGTVTPVDWTPKSRPRRQQMPELLIENGAFYITKKENFLKSHLRYSGRIGTVKMPLKRSFQIDTEDELSLITSIIQNGVHND